MTENTKSTPSTPSKKTPIKGPYIATALMFVVVLFLWIDLSHTKATLAEQTAQLQQSLADSQSKLAAANTELDFFKTGEINRAIKERDAQKKPSVQAPVEEPETLLLQEPTVSKTTEGLVARFSFKPDDIAALPNQITLVVRVPSSSNAKILKLAPVSETNYSNVEYKVNSKGFLGMIEGAPSDLAALEFELTVSAPVKAIVRGSDGIRDFELDITSTECTVRKL